MLCFKVDGHRITPLRRLVSNFDEGVFADWSNEIFIRQLIKDLIKVLFNICHPQFVSLGIFFMEWKNYFIFDQKIRTSLIALNRTLSCISLGYDKKLWHSQAMAKDMMANCCIKLSRDLKISRRCGLCLDGNNTVRLPLATTIQSPSTTERLINCTVDCVCICRNKLSNKINWRKHNKKEWWFCESIQLEKEKQKKTLLSMIRVIFGRAKPDEKLNQFQHKGVCVAIAYCNTSLVITLN